jgi:hypothetical protein
MYARFVGRVAQEFQVQAGRSELWGCRDSGLRHASGHPMSGKKEKALVRVLRSQTLSQHGTIHGSREGKGVAPELLLTRVIVVQSVPVLPTIPSISTTGTNTCGGGDGIQACKQTI